MYRAIEWYDLDRERTLGVREYKGMRVLKRTDV